MTGTTEPAWEDLQRTVRAFVRRRIRNPADVDDVVQRVFMRLHQGLGTLRDDERLHAWIHATARNVITDHYRASARQREWPAGVAGDMDALAVEPPGQENAALQELAGCMPPLLATLPAADREALQLTEIDGRTQAEAAALLGLSLSGMKSRVQRARRRLKGVVDTCCRVEMDRRGSIVSYERRAGTACDGCGGD
ncbi:MAG: RNA polymerase sigma factor SigZ [Vicinamibacterales bacterium]|nr:RNA polymerase sigma factor SigZ [Vicinamibacterales bacterium]